MIAAIVQTAFRSLRRDRGALILSFVLPIAFFSIFAIVFANGTGGNGTPRVGVLIVDEDRSAVSERLVRALGREGSLRTRTRPESRQGEPAKPEYTARTAEAAVKAGDAPAALIIPGGFGANPVAFGPGAVGKPLRILHDSSDPIAAQVVGGMVQKVMASSLPDAIAGLGMTYFDQASGGLTAAQRKSLDSNLAGFSKYLAHREKEPAAGAGNDDSGGFVASKPATWWARRNAAPPSRFMPRGSA
jgi:ABC-2 type transport system permease protein